MTPSEDTVEALGKIVPAIRRRLPGVRIVVRGDSGFCRKAIMAWCEAHEVSYVLGLARNARLEALLVPSLDAARARHCLCGGAASRVFAEFSYRTQKSWSRERRVIGKAEVTSQGDTPRFIVTNLSASGFEKEVPGCFEPQALYEDFCGPRGQMENMIKQMQIDLHAGRTSTHHLGSNQLWLWLSAFGYILLERLRALYLRGTELGRASVGTIRLRLLKIAGHVCSEAG